MTNRSSRLKDILDKALFNRNQQETDAGEEEYDEREIDFNDSFEMDMLEILERESEVLDATTTTVILKGGNYITTLYSLLHKRIGDTDFIVVRYPIDAYINKPIDVDSLLQYIIRVEDVDSITTNKLLQTEIREEEEENDDRETYQGE